MQETLKEFYDKVVEVLTPNKYLEWQTFLRLSLFSWLIAALLAVINGEEAFSVEVVSTLSWVFLTSAIWWAIDDNKDQFTAYDFYFGPWITGAVLCFFLFRPWESSERSRWAISCWPLISTTIKALPHFVNWELKFSLPKKDNQQSLVMTLLVNLLLTSWILFSYRIQDWVQNYPSLLVSDLSRSAFVYDFVSDRAPQSQGVPLIEQTALAVTGELNGQPWYQTERWLYARRDRLENIAQRTIDDLAAPDEQIFWQMAVPQPRRLGEGYLLTLRADWLGPTAGTRDFYVEKTCKITPEERVRLSSAQQTGEETEEDGTAPTTQFTVVDCGEDPASIQWTDSAN